MSGGSAHDYPDDRVSVSESTTSAFDLSAAAHGLSILAQQLGMPADKICPMLSSNMGLWPMLNINSQSDIDELHQMMQVLDPQQEFQVIGFQRR